MRIGFYAPLKPPDHPVPSGDRRVARGFMGLLDRLGHNVEVVSRFRSFDRHGDAARQDRVRVIGGSLARRLTRRCVSGSPLDLWVTYHCHHKAPDWLGPAVTGALDLPYVIAEASATEKVRGRRASWGRRQRSLPPTWCWQ